MIVTLVQYLRGFFSDELYCSIIIHELNKSDFTHSNIVSKIQRHFTMRAFLRLENRRKAKNTRRDSTTE